MNKYTVSKGRLRRVRTPEGSRYFGLPIGSLITPAAIYAAKRRHGHDSVMTALGHEDVTPVPSNDRSLEIRNVGMRTSEAFGRVRHPDGELSERIRRARENFKRSENRRSRRRNSGEGPNPPRAR